MYNHLEFKDVNSHNSTNYDELIQLANDNYSYNNNCLDLSLLNITDSGTLLTGTNELQMTQPAFVSLCRRLHIPDPFAKYIPWDLLKHNIESLATSSDQQVQLFTRPSDGVVVNVASDNFVPVNHQVFINNIREHSPNVKRGVISDINMQIDVTNPSFNEDIDFGEMEIEKGDIIESGLNFNNSTAGHNYTNAKIFLWRLVCTNGMTMPTRVGFVKLRSKVGRKIDVAVTRFLKNVQQLSVDATNTERQFKSLNRPFNVVEFSKYWKGVEKIVRDPEAVDDDIFKVDTEERRIYMAQDRAYKKGTLDKIEPTKVNGYKMVNNLTDRAKEFEQTIQAKMEAFGGKIVADQIGRA